MFPDRGIVSYTWHIHVYELSPIRFHSSVKMAITMAVDVKNKVVDACMFIKGESNNLTCKYLLNITLQTEGPVEINNTYEETF